MRILVTRPEPDASRQAELLKAHGHEPVLAPLLQIEFVNDISLPLDRVGALIATSANALRAIAGHASLDQALGRPLFAVGRATAAAAKELGFVQVIEGPGTGEALAHSIEDSGVNGPFLHLCGDDIAFDLVTALRRAGLKAERIVVYCAKPAEALPAAARESIEQVRLDGVILMSPRTAEIFSNLIRRTGLERQAQRLVCYCLSEAVARRVASLGCKIRVAATPTGEEVLALLDAKRAS